MPELLTDKINRMRTFIEILSYHTGYSERELQERGTEPILQPYDVELAIKEWQGQKLPLDSVSVSSFREIPIAPMTDLEKQFNISTHDAAIRTLKEMNIPQNLIEKKSNSR